MTAGVAGRGSHAGPCGLSDLADRATLTEQMSVPLDRCLGRATEGRRRVLVDLAVAVARSAFLGSRVLADQAEVFGSVARELVWTQRAEVTGALGAIGAGGGSGLPGLMIDQDGTVVVCHSEKQQAAPTFNAVSAISQWSR